MFFALLGFSTGLTVTLACIILGQHGFSVVKSIGFITLITLGGIPGFYTAATLLESIGRKLTTALFLALSALMAFIYGHSATPTTLFISGFIMQFFMFGMWSCLYAYTPELSPTRARSTGAGVASAFGRLGAIHRAYRGRLHYRHGRRCRRVYAWRGELCRRGTHRAAPRS